MAKNLHFLLTTILQMKLTHSTIHYNIGVLMASRLDSPFDLERCAPAVDLALEDVNEKFLTPHNVRLMKVQSRNKLLEYIIPGEMIFLRYPVLTQGSDFLGAMSIGEDALKRYPSCSGAVAPGLAADMFFKDNVIAFVGPACAFALDPVARLAAYWNRPIITGMGDQGIFKDKSEYPTLTRMSYCQCRLKIVFSSIFNEFGWKHVALILDRSDLFSLIVGKNLESGLKKNGLLSFVRELDGNDEDSKCDQFLKDASMYARVVILSVRGVLVRKFMLAAHSLGMTRGDWTFLDVEIVQGSYWGDHDWQNGDDLDADARKAYESLLRVSLLEPTSTSYHEFSDRVKDRAQRFYNYTYTDGEEVNFFVGAFYDGVQLLGMALNETLTMGGDIKDGKAITKLMWNRSFHGITGDVRIDENGDRDADYSILDLDPINGKFEVVAHYYGMTRQYTPVPGKKIHWPGGKDGPMRDIPRCGFMGNDPQCHTHDPFSIIIYSCSAFAVVFACMISLACLANKQMKLLADLNNMSWKIKPAEVLLELNRPYSSRINLQKPDAAENTCVQIFEPLIPDRYFRRKSNDSNCSLLGAHVYTNVGIYKGSRVAIKKVVKKKVDVNKKLLWEIKQVRDVTHENTVRFVGACIEYPCILILTEYCPKGSLKDVLQNDQLKLDWNFRMCLIHDIVKGMTYLHASELGVHGKLRSSNCLIDGRFVVKISDFGLNILTTPSEVIQDASFYNKLLWVAPELLPVTVVPGSPATQKGDVFSFSIILEEIVVRGGPYEVAKQFLSTREILKHVQDRDYPSFRPDISGTDCPPDVKILMEKCWLDCPEDRPTFETIKSNIRTIMKGYCENLMDDLLRRMEQYANNLEALVEEKTEQLSQEKRRSEELLYQVLPRPVAQQLMAGEMVHPEHFECVTVYFSDIVGFTSLCAQSSPMQVVTLLNDLYSTFDRVIGAYDVYKVETIGDAYMVVSGLPERNGDHHAREICKMALAILEAVQSFSIQHKPEAQLKVRIGIHSGPVCAGVVGQKMPHYCLFGDTVNTASRMESSGEPLRIHVSHETKKILDTFETFDLELRGDVELKGKGLVTTYWLLYCSEPPRGAMSPQNLSDNVETYPYPLIFPELTINK